MRSKKRSKSSKSSKAPGVTTLIRAAALSLLITVPFSLLLLLIAASLLLKTDNPSYATGVTGTAVLLLSALIAGVLATRLHHRKTPLLCGITTGILLLLCLCITSVVLPVNEAPRSLLISLLLHAAVLPLAILGAKLGGREAGRHKK